MDYQILEGKDLEKSCNFRLAGLETSANPLNVDFNVANGNLSLAYPLVWPLSVGSHNNTNETRIFNYFNLFTDAHHFLAETNPLMALGFAAPLIKTVEQNTYVPTTIEAHICVLSPYSRKYNISMINGVMKKTKIDEDYGTMFTNEREDSGSLCWRPRKPHEVNITKVGYDYGAGEDRIWCGIDLSWVQMILELFYGTYNTTWLGSAYRTYPMFPSGNYILNNFLSKEKYDPTVFMPGVSEALTYLNLHNNPGDSRYISAAYGVAYTDKVFVRVRWSWLSLPIALNALGLIFLVTTAIYSKRRRVPLWKSSAFALLYHGFEEQLIGNDKLYKNASDMKKAASTTYVKLAPLGNGRKRLVLQ